MNMNIYVGKIVNVQHNNGRSFIGKILEVLNPNDNGGIESIILETTNDLKLYELKISDITSIESA